MLVIPKAVFCHDLHQMTFASGGLLHGQNYSVFTARAWLESRAFAAAYTIMEKFMTIRTYLHYVPVIADGGFVDESAVVIGRVNLGADVSVWPLVAIRGDVHDIKIGARTNIQDGSVLHTTSPESFPPNGFPLTIGEDVTVGHKVILHGCTIGDRVLIGMGSIVMDGAVVEADVIVGGGSLVSPGKVLASGGLYVGSPAKRVRDLRPEELEFLRYSASHYVKLKNLHQSSPQALS